MHFRTTNSYMSATSLMFAAYRSALSLQQLLCLRPLHAMTPQHRQALVRQTLASAYIAQDVSQSPCQAPVAPVRAHCHGDACPLQRCYTASMCWDTIQRPCCSK